MHVEYLPLLKLSLQHDYFPKGNCPVVEVVPTQVTQTIMRQLGIRMVNRDYGVELFYSSGTNAQGRLLRELQEQVVRLSFILRPNDPLFYNYTVLPPELFAEKVPYYTNLDTATSFSIAELPRLPAEAANLQITVNTPGATLSIADELGNTLYAYPGDEPEDSSGPITPAGAAGNKLMLNLSENTPGKYYLLEGEDSYSTLLYLPANWRQGDLALVTLYLGDTGDKGVHLLDNGSIAPAEFTATFQARATKWRYHLVDQQDTLDDFKLLESGTETVVAELENPPVTRALPNGTKAFVLSSPDTIPLRGRPGQLFELSARAKDNNRQLSIPLPSADANRITQDEADKSVFYSDMYVYL